MGADLVGDSLVCGIGDEFQSDKVRFLSIRAMIDYLLSVCLAYPW
jgi:hypothetical protein